MSVLRLIFWAFVLVLGLSFFGISIQSIVMSPTGQANFSYLFSFVTKMWQWMLHALSIYIK